MSELFKINVKVNDQRTVAAFQKAPARMHQLVGDAVWRGALEVTREARRNAPKAFSTLINSINATQIGELHWRVQPGVNYAAAVEDGRKKGKQPGTANGLMEWVRQKTGLQGRPLDRATFAIARAIGQRGIKPQPYIQPAVVSKESRVIELVRLSVERGCAECFA